MAVFNGKQMEPFHSGEVFHLWSYLYNTQCYMVTLQVFINHTDDQQLNEILNDMLENLFKEEQEQVEAILKETGIRLPPSPPDRPNVEVQDIPAGARFNDSEIVQLVLKELLNSKLACSYLVGISIFQDIRTLFQDFQRN
ncbi:DUF3231 family protein [Paracerasibacillus soli]|uniref:DUF3231 family protein n=1 Tax=Paracerasibacillus soli TaxID=480284 RepID=A0ABU5CP51_9BACI|nr:DUF3231 family protein [Virgibacillus soli]MDY0408005.1 DUF3231 family protein [Virgibacillus soli]